MESAVSLTSTTRDASDFFDPGQFGDFERKGLVWCSEANVIAIKYIRPIPAQRKAFRMEASSVLVNLVAVAWPLTCGSVAHEHHLSIVRLMLANRNIAEQ